MDCIYVTTQEQLDAALADAGPGACIHLDAGDAFEISSSGSATVTASGSATVRASGSATVRASGSATVRASGSATVTASGSATVRASGSATVTASGSATVRAYDSATVTAYDSATVTASGSATVRASGSATVTASGSATVTAYDSATVRASGSATVTGSPYTAVHQLSPHVTITGTPHVIQPPNLDGAETATWLAYHGIEPDANGIVHLFKAADDRYTTERGWDYSPGATPEAARWVADAKCGNGLHFGPTPVHAMAYHAEATRFLACPVRVEEIAVIDQQKVKARRVVAPGCREVDIDGMPLAREPEDVGVQAG